MTCVWLVHPPPTTNTTCIRQYSATMSIMEVYCEQLNDLLDPSKVNLEVAEVPVKGATPGLTTLVIKGLTEVKVSSLQAALELFKKGQDARKVRVMPHCVCCWQWYEKSLVQLVAAANT